MYEIRQTLGIKNRKFSLWCHGKEIVRSLSKTAATKLVESFLENYETLQKRSQVLDETIFPFIEKGGETGGSGCDFANTDKHGDQVRAGSLPISQTGEDVGSACRRSDTGEAESAAKLHQEHLIAEYRELDKKFRMGVDKITEESRTIAAVAQIALDTASKLNSENARLRNGQRLNTGGDRTGGKGELSLDIFTIDVVGKTIIE